MAFMKPAAVILIFVEVVLLVGCYEVSGGGRDANRPEDVGTELHPEEARDWLPPSDWVDLPERDVPPEVMPPITVERYCAARAEGICDYFNSCCTREELMWLREMLEIDCSNHLRSNFYLWCVEDYEPVIQAGNIVIDPSGMAAMRETLASFAVSCPSFGTYPLLKGYYYRELMSTVLIGRLAEGERCRQHMECAPGFFCDFYPNGACARRVRPGGACRYEDECQIGYVCSRDRCREPSSEGGFCEEFSDCGIGLWCRAGLCVPQLPAGEDCLMEDEDSYHARVSVRSMNISSASVSAMAYRAPDKTIPCCDKVLLERSFHHEIS